MIHVDESDPVGEIEQSFPSRDVVIKRGVDAKELFELVTEIGRGKFGTVYRCQEKATGLQLAAKFVPIPKRDDRRNVEREVELMNSLQHTLIIQLYDAFEYQKMMCVVLELVEGGELFDRVIDDDFVLTERACSVFLRQVCQAMEFVHRNSVIHLDLKPENIMCLSREGNRIKIIDFGLARKYDPSKKLQVLFGTPEFVAPEVVNFDQISFGTDMWSVGVICYVLLSGLSPFMGGTDVETMANVTIGKYDFDDEAFNDVSKEAMDFIKKLLVKDSSCRMTASQCMEHKWLKRRKGPKLMKSKSKANGKLKTSKIPTSPTTDTIPQVRPDDGDDDGNGGQPELMANGDSENNNNNNNIDIVNNNKNLNQHDLELKTSKDNLKSFIERWEEHPNSPYVFDTDTNHISPAVSGGGLDAVAAAAHPKRVNGGNSGLSSRGCSPSPCESLSSDTQQPSTSESNTCSSISTHHHRNPIVDNPPSVIRQRSELFEQSDSNDKLKDYLQSFERRHSDSNCALDRSTSYEKVNLADEIKKLSERLLMLSSMNDGIDVKEKRMESVEVNPETSSSDAAIAPREERPKPATVPKPMFVHEPPKVLHTKPTIKEKPEFLKNRSRSHMEEMFTKSITNNSDHSFTTRTTSTTRTFTRASSVVNTSSFSSRESFGNLTGHHKYQGGLFERLQLLDEMPTLQPKLGAFRQKSENTDSQPVHLQPKTPKKTINDFPPESFAGTSSFSRNLPWTSGLSTRRTKFRVTQLSRDVPIGMPDTHQPVFIEEAQKTTKDCLLHLLDKYNEADQRTAFSHQRVRHQSLSVSRSDPVEQRSMNSLNFFFQRHATAGNSVKQIQAQLESKRQF